MRLKKGGLNIIVKRLSLSLLFHIFKGIIVKNSLFYTLNIDHVLCCLKYLLFILYTLWCFGYFNESLRQKRIIDKSKNQLQRQKEHWISCCIKIINIRNKKTITFFILVFPFCTLYIKRKKSWCRKKIVYDIFNLFKYENIELNNI